MPGKQWGSPAGCTGGGRQRGGVGSGMAMGRPSHWAAAARGKGGPDSRQESRKERARISARQAAQAELPLVESVSSSSNALKPTQAIVNGISLGCQSTHVVVNGLQPCLARHSRDACACLVCCKLQQGRPQLVCLLLLSPDLT